MEELEVIQWSPTIDSIRSRMVGSIVCYFKMLTHLVVLLRGPQHKFLLMKLYTRREGDLYNYLFRD